MTLLVSSCGIVETNDSAVLDGLKPLVDQHAEALYKDGGKESTVTGARLISVFDYIYDKNKEK